MYLLLLSLLLTSSACFNVAQNSCVNNFKNETRSPDNALKAIIFERDCGATVSTEVSILPVDGNLNNETGNVFIYKTDYLEKETAGEKTANVEVKWMSENQIIISFDDFTTTKVGKMRQQIENVKIIYDKRQVVSN